MKPNPYEPPATRSSNSPEHSMESDDCESLQKPTLAYTANGNLEAHAVVMWLQSNGVRAYAVEDQSGVSLFAFGTISQFHKPQVFVEKSDIGPAGDLLRQFEARRLSREAKLENAPPIESMCDQCGTTSEFPALEDGTTQNCPKCNSYMDVGEIDWPDDFDFTEEAETAPTELSLDDALDSASQLDKTGDWTDSIAAYRNIAARWPEHADYATNCIASIQRKIDAASE
ncbi:hypothetical protein SAMN06265222_117123 [Neorhodopirellula lusitana]|uniref:DUF2007 domain-containing protein n=1 Tax=Neorhodopirellula lusitana TaxID=445327 RepID=A0ABY1QPG5_9BACT|nr:hypothetical protein [Neorhodopirellula lusitana]SMP74406.1 hypothetical protein SAMN06265222_117123 [Neorhodopirellula lusitana]